jgi:signal transduction histidine kinase
MADAHLEPAELALLRDSAKRARARWERGYPGAIGDHALTTSMQAVLIALSGEPGDPLPPELREPPAHLTVRRTLVDLLRSEFLRGLAPLSVDGSDPERVVMMLRRFEEARDALDPEGEQQVHAGLMGPEAHHILTEVGHDLRSPLTSVLFLSDALRAGHSGAVNAHQGRQLALIYSAALTMLTIVNNFMELSRRGDGPTDSVPTPFSVADILDSVRSTVQPMADERALRLELDIFLDGDRRVGHPVALSRVLLNLATNALKFTEAGSVHMRARDVGGESVEFSVRDTGIGMSSEEREAIFNVFEPTVESGGVRFSGSGLGLVIVRKLLRSLDSELRCESEPHQGTRFSFRVMLPSPAD